MEPNIQVGKNASKKIADELAHVLADTYMLALKTQNYHWNVVGPRFKSLHDMFEEQYTDLRNKGDEVAERIRALGHLAPGSYKAFSELTSIEEETGHPKAEKMVANLVKDLETLIKTSNKARETAQDAGDEGTVDLLNTMVFDCGKQAWMLRATIED